MAKTGKSNKTVKKVARIVFTKTSCDLPVSKIKVKLFECQQDSGHIISIIDCNFVSFSGMAF